MRDVMLSDVAELNPETLPATTPVNYQFRYLDLSAVKNGSIDWAAAEKMQFGDAPSRARRQVRANDCLLGTVRPQQRSHGFIDRDDVDLVASTAFVVVRAKPGIADPRFLFHYILSDLMLRQMDAAAVGSNYPAVNESDVASLVIKLPDFKKQRRIAEILDALDDQLAACRYAITKLERVRTALGEQFLPRREKSVLSDGWELRTLADIVAAPICYGIIQVGSPDPQGVPVVMIRDLGADFGSDLYRVPKRLDESYARSRIRGGDVLLSIKGTAGRAAVVPDHFVGNISRDIARIRLDGSVVPEFLQWMLRTAYGQRLLESLVVGSTRPEISISVLNRLSIPVPSLQEQHRIVQTVSSVDTQVTNERSRLEKLQLSKLGLLDDLLSGRVRV